MRRVSTRPRLPCDAQSRVERDCLKSSPADNRRSCLILDLQRLPASPATQRPARVRQSATRCDSLPGKPVDISDIAPCSSLKRPPAVLFKFSIRVTQVPAWYLTSALVPANGRLRGAQTSNHKDWIERGDTRFFHLPIFYRPAKTEHEPTLSKMR